MSFLINPYAFLAAGGDFESIATVTVGSGGASSIEFTSIPATYQHLQVRTFARDSRATTLNNIRFTLNADTGANYADHLLAGDGSSVSASGRTSQSSSVRFGLSVGASTASNIFAASITDILDYANTSKNTTVRSFAAYDANGAGSVRLASTLWMSTTAVNQITLTPDVTGNFQQYTTAALYGVKA